VGLLPVVLIGNKWITLPSKWVTLPVVLIGTSGSPSLLVLIGTEWVHWVTLPVMLIGTEWVHLPAVLIGNKWVHWGHPTCGANR
jgi:hypothetical protein